MGITVPILLLLTCRHFTRSSIFNYTFTKYLKSNNTNYTTNNRADNLSYYLSGLLEGDGHISVPKTLNNSTDKLRIAFIEVVFALKDEPSAELLKNIFGGNVYKRSNKNCVRWMVQDKNSVIKVINSVNGKFRTPKIKALHSIIDYFNSKGEKIVKLTLDTTPLDSNAWFAGFIDSDGSFMIKGFPTNSTEKNLRTYIALQFYLPQRAKDVSGESMEPVMKNIADFLQVKLNSREFKGKFPQYIVNTSNNVSNLKLIQYLNTFHLLSSKFLDAKDWEKAYNLFSEKLYKNPVHYEEIRKLKLNMNKNRTSFSWSHHKSDVYDLN